MGIFSGISDFFGLDIGMSAVRVVQLRSKGSNRIVFRYGKMPIQVGLSEQDDVENLTRLADVIRQALIKYKITTRNVVVGLPTRHVYTTTKEFNIPAGNVLEQAIKHQLNSIIPKFKESKVSWGVLDRDLKDKSKQEVFFCAINKQYIQRRLEMLESINLNILAFEPDGLALIRSIADRQGTLSLVLDIGFRYTDIIVCQRNQPRLVETEEFGVANILKSVINNLHSDQRESQKLMFAVGMGDPVEQALLRSTIIQSLDNLMSKLTKTINFFNSRSPDQKLDKVILFGDAVYIPGFVEYLAEALNMTIQIGNTWQNVLYSPQIQPDLQAISPNFGVTSGLAQRQVI